MKRWTLWVVDGNGNEQALGRYRVPWGAAQAVASRMANDPMLRTSTLVWGAFRRLAGQSELGKTRYEARHDDGRVVRLAEER